jgi:hypothetical protein
MVTGIATVICNGLEGSPYLVDFCIGLCRL